MQSGPVPTTSNTFCLFERAPSYSIQGEIVGVERKRGARAGLFDVVTFRLEMLDEGDAVAVIATNSWLFLRSE